MAVQERRATWHTRGTGGALFTFTEPCGQALAGVIFTATFDSFSYNIDFPQRISSRDLINPRETGTHAGRWLRCCTRLPCSPALVEAAAGVGGSHIDGLCNSLPVRVEDVPMPWLVRTRRWIHLRLSPSVIEHHPPGPSLGTRLSSRVVSPRMHGVGQTSKCRITELG